MSDDRIIDFNDLKNKVKDSDVDKFEQYIYKFILLCHGRKYDYG